ncbi:unnamed protein product, partial [Ixodes persulcatus]
GAIQVWLSVPSCTLLDLLMTSSSGGSRTSKKKTVQFALPGRIVRPLQWRDDVIWARVEAPRKRPPNPSLEDLFQPEMNMAAGGGGGHRRNGSNCSSIDSTYANSSSQDDNHSSSSRDSVSNVVIVSCSGPGQRSIVRIGSDSTSVDSTRTDSSSSRADSDYQSKGDSTESSLAESPTSDQGRGPPSIKVPLRPCGDCMQCALMDDSLRRADLTRRETDLKLRSYESQIRSLQQACDSAETALRDERSLHAVTRQELSRVVERLKFYTGSKIALSAVLKDYRTLRNCGTLGGPQSLRNEKDVGKDSVGVQWNRTFRKSRGAKVAETKHQQVICIQHLNSLGRNSDIGVQVNLHSARLDEDRSKLTAKMRYGIAAVFQDKSAKTLPPRVSRNSSNRISKPLRGVITEREMALGILSKEVKLLQEERDHLQELLTHSLQDVVPQHLSHVSRELQEQLSGLRAENQRLLESYNAERLLRKKYYNMVEDLKGKIRVYCRIKPKCGNQLNNKTFVNVLEPTDDYTLIVHTQRGDKEFTFDRIFLPQHTQEEVFTETNSLVQSAMDGYNVCIFAYGQTGSGKTYTLTGNSNTEQLDAEGIAPRAFRRIFDLVRGNEEKQDFVVTATFLELYNERFIDLLRNDGDPEEKLEVRKDSSGHTYVPGATVEEVSNSAQLLDCFVRALGNRRVACTRMNVESSRSHFVATVLISSTNRLTGSVLRGKLSLVDLAGSERLEKSGLEGNYIRETNSINKSLSALGDVIHALAAQQSHVPYRNNKLTMLMQDSIGGSAKTLMFVNVSSDVDNVEESVNSLVYATRVRQITNDVVRASETKEIAKLKSV